MREEGRLELQATDQLTASHAGDAISGGRKDASESAGENSTHLGWIGSEARCYRLRQPQPIKHVAPFGSDQQRHSLADTEYAREIGVFLWIPNTSVIVEEH